MVALKMAALILSLGMDTLLMSISLGFLRTTGRFKIALTFASAEALMPLIGLALGEVAGRFIGAFASLVGGIALMAVAVWLIFFDDDDDAPLDKPVTGWALLLTAVSISLDELAVGFSIGLVGVPIALTIGLIAIQAFVFTLLGLSFSSILKPYIGEWSERVAGIALGLLGIWIGVEAAIHLAHR